MTASEVVAQVTEPPGTTCLTAQDNKWACSAMTPSILSEIVQTYSFLNSTENQHF